MWDNISYDTNMETVLEDLSTSTRLEGPTSSTPLDCDHHASILHTITTEQELALHPLLLLIQHEQIEDLLSVSLYPGVCSMAFEYTS